MTHLMAGGLTAYIGDHETGNNDIDHGVLSEMELISPDGPFNETVKMVEKHQGESVTICNNIIKR